MKGFWHPLKDSAVILGSRHIVSLQNQRQHEKPMCHADRTAATLVGVISRLPFWPGIYFLELSLFYVTTFTMVRYRLFFVQNAFNGAKADSNHAGVFLAHSSAYYRLIFNHHLFDLLAPLLWNCLYVDDLMKKMNFCAILILDWSTMYLIEPARKNPGETLKNLLLVRD